MNRRQSHIFTLLVACVVTLGATDAVARELPRLKVSDHKRFIIYR